MTPEVLHPVQSWLSPHSSICKQTQMEQEMCPGGQGRIHIVWWRSLAKVIQRFIINFSNNHKNCSSSAQYSKFTEVNGVREAENLSFMSWKLVPSMSGLDRCDGDSTRKLTPIPRYSSKVPASIAPSWGNQSETCSLTTLHLSSSPDHWRKIGTRQKISFSAHGLWDTLTLKSLLCHLFSISIFTLISEPCQNSQFCTLEIFSIVNPAVTQSSELPWRSKLSPETEKQESVCSDDNKYNLN